jgi:Frataxin-like domain
MVKSTTQVLSHHHQQTQSHVTRCQSPPVGESSIPNASLSMSCTRGFLETPLCSLSRRRLSSGLASHPHGKQMPLASPYITALLSMRGFRSTALVEFPMRRTRGRSARQSLATSQYQDDDDDDEEDELTAGRDGRKRRKGPKHAVMDPVEFQKASAALLDKLYKALSPMKEVNDPFLLSRGYDSEIGGGEFILIDLGAMQGQYTIQVDPEQCMLFFQSPISGHHDYYLSNKNSDEKHGGEWIGAQDGHNFEGLLVRDLIRQCKGMPNL